MDTTNTLTNFNASEVPLASSNLIEASAGTGKTYSIAILVLRLLLEKQIAIKEILMVTFTKAAVAELEERVRLFVRSAHKVANGKEIADSTIEDLVKRSIAELGQGKVEDLLNDAIVFLDETSVMTIHSFCQQTLTEFAFETNQLFGLEIVNDISLMIEDEVNKFWRKNITLIPTELLRNLLAAGLSRSSITEVIAAFLQGKKYITYQEDQRYSFTDEEQLEVQEILLKLIQNETDYHRILCDRVTENMQELREISNANSHAKRSVAPLIEQPEAFLKFIQTATAQYVQKLYPDWVDACEELSKLTAETTIYLQSILDTLYAFSIQTILKNIAEYKHRNSILSFNDLIDNLHKALVKQENEHLVMALRKKYKAVFVDEFQDTDRLQYEIFQEGFGKNTILFYIGDPKQSIYAWRQADINTYFNAFLEVSARYGMNINYRSSAPFIHAMNLFFKPDENFDTFSFNGKQQAIEYIAVDSPQANKKGVLYEGDQPDVPITIFEDSNKEEIALTLTAQVIHVLGSGLYQLEKGDSKKQISPSDIGILVRTNAQGRDIKKSLARYGVPAITIDDEKILKAAEAQYLVYLLLAFQENKSANIHKALLSPFTGYTRNEIVKLNAEEALERFKGYGMLWQKSGIYVTLMQFVADYSVKARLLLDKDGERTLTNLIQLIEILHKVQTRKKLSNIELIHWLKRGTEGMQIEGDEFEQRVESDEDAVKIVTIHKSKGLEYPIVFAPFLDLQINNKKDSFCSFREEDSGEYVFALRDQLNHEQLQAWEEQEEQEYRRLIYVAITRAIYKCYINSSSSYKKSSLKAFVDGLKRLGDTAGLIQFKEAPAIPLGYQYVEEKKRNAQFIRKAHQFNLTEKYWRKLSYTYLSRKSPYIPKDNTHVNLNEYDQFVFKQLIKGSVTGNMLHYIFENIDFSASQYWERVVVSALKRFMPNYLESYAPMLLNLLEHTLNAEINHQTPHVNFRLSDIERNKKLTELEFDFNVPVFNTNSVDLLSRSDSQLHTNYHDEVEGMMNGKIDLFFEHQGNYYILDWKSNFLGDTIAYYQTEGLKEAMNHHNYHLQYLIYTVAAKKYLQQRIPNFNYEQHFGGVVYVFLRGARAGTKNGIFTYKPDIDRVLSLEKLISR